MFTLYNRFAVLGALATLLGCELYKFLTKQQIRDFAQRVLEQQIQEEEARLAKFRSSPSLIDGENEKKAESTGGSPSRV